MYSIVSLVTMPAIEAASAPPVIDPSLVQVGAIVARLSFEGLEDSAAFKVRSVIGELGRTELRPAEQRPDSSVAYITRAIDCSAEAGYHLETDQVVRSLLSQARESTDVAYDREMLLPCLVATEPDIIAGLEGLLNNRLLAANGNSWTLSVIGFASFCNLARRLWSETGEPDIGVKFHTAHPEHTHIQRRAFVVSYLAGRALDGFSVMPVEQK
jgi:hypothetical protein